MNSVYTDKDCGKYKIRFENSQVSSLFNYPEAKDFFKEAVDYNREIEIDLSKVNYENSLLSDIWSIFAKKYGKSEGKKVMDEKLTLIVSKGGRLHNKLSIIYPGVFNLSLEEKVA